jgi:UDP-glucuronate 4-epimerase
VDEGREIVAAAARAGVTLMVGHVERFNPAVAAIKQSLSGEDSLSIAITRVGPFLHLAAQAGVRYSLDHPHAYVDSNLEGFINVLEGCRHNDCQHLLFASSSSVYGANTKLPFSVRDNVDHPISLYAASGKANELIAHAYSHLYRIPATGLRFFTVYGPWGRPDMAMFIFAKAILTGEPIKLFNHGKMRRDFTYIDASARPSFACWIDHRKAIRIGAATHRIRQLAARHGGSTISATTGRKI